MKQKFNVGDVVRLKSGTSPLMVRHVSVPRSDGYTMYYCEYTDGSAHGNGWKTENTLERYYPTYYPTEPQTPKVYVIVRTEKDGTGMVTVRSYKSKDMAQKAAREYAKKRKDCVYHVLESIEVYSVDAPEEPPVNVEVL